jgi:hypothetical protein
LAGIVPVRSQAVGTPVGKVFQDFLASLLTKFYRSRNYYVMRNHDPAEEYLTVAQFAAEVGRPVSTIHNWIATGRIAATKIGDGRTSAYVIPRIEVDALTNRQAVG